MIGMICLKAAMGYICTILIVILLGVGSRTYTEQLPSFLASHAGDALWGSMIYFIFRVLLPEKPLLLSLYLSLIVSFGIEISQLYQQDWINEIRSTIIGGLVLGKGFLWIDLVRYTIGVSLAFVMDYGYRHMNKS